MDRYDEKEQRNGRKVSFFFCVGVVGRAEGARGGTYDLVLSFNLTHCDELIDHDEMLCVHV